MYIWALSVFFFYKIKLFHHLTDIPYIAHSVIGLFIQQSSQEKGLNDSLHGLYFDFIVYCHLFLSNHPMSMF